MHTIGGGVFARAQSKECQEGLDKIGSGLQVDLEWLLLGQEP